MVTCNYVIFIGDGQVQLIDSIRIPVTSTSFKRFGQLRLTHHPHHLLLLSLVASRVITVLAVKSVVKSRRCPLLTNTRYSSVPARSILPFVWQSFSLYFVRLKLNSTKTKDEPVARISQLMSFIFTRSAWQKIASFFSLFFSCFFCCSSR